MTFVKSTEKLNEENSEEEFEEVSVEEEFEEFEILKDYPDYSISKPSHMEFIVKNNITDRILKRGETKEGYYLYGLHKDGKQKTELLHRIVARQFLGYDPQGKDKGLIIDHIDNDHHNNFIENFQIISYSENSKKNHFQTRNSSKYIEELPDGEKFKLISFKGFIIPLNYIRVGNEIYHKITKNKYLQLAKNKNNIVTIEIKINGKRKALHFTLNSKHLITEKVE
jgi:hypothetical protein